MKKCSKCGVLKELFEFGKDKPKKDGLTSACRDCRGKQAKGYYMTETEFYFL